MQQDSERRSNAARTEATRGALIAAARTLFVEKGYAETSTPEIVKSAGITRGALYHHFADKADLFRAVLRKEFEAVEAEINASAKASESAIDALLDGGRGYLDAMRAPGRVRLMLLDGPAVLGRMELDKMDRETSADSLRLGLEAAMNASEVRRLPLVPLTAQLSAMFDRAALGVSEGEDAEDHLTVFAAILEALRP
ncbi:MAG: helix-turn-helix domain-containing protein [Paracoccaceae bacterium]|nr:helix-turn-helix domain-containing protein [Paracoccaceae bacterium]